jgi:hypothetical protein
MGNKETEHLPDGGKMMSSIEYYKESIDYLFEKYIESEFVEEDDLTRKDRIFKEVEKMRMQELKHAYEAEQNNCRGIFKYESFEHYYQETFNPQEDDKV